MSMEGVSSARCAHVTWWVIWNAREKERRNIWWNNSLSGIYLFIVGKLLYFQTGDTSMHVLLYQRWWVLTPNGQCGCGWFILIKHLIHLCNLWLSVDSSVSSNTKIISNRNSIPLFLNGALIDHCIRFILKIYRHLSYFYRCLKYVTSQLMSNISDSDWFLPS